MTQERMADADGAKGNRKKRGKTKSSNTEEKMGDKKRESEKHALLRLILHLVEI